MSGPVDLGQTYRYTFPVHNTAGVLANAGTVTATVTLPDGTTATPTVVNSATGLYDIAYLTTQAGLHSLKGTATGGVLGSEFDVWEDAFTVETSGRMLISVDEASARLRASGVITSDSDREQLRWLCMVATDAVERDLNRIIVRRTVGPETHDGNVLEVQLRKHPIISVATVVESGASLTGGDYFLSSSTGMLYRGTTTAGLWWASGRQNIVVTYVAGYTDPPRSAREVALGAVQELWQSSQQAAHPLINEDVELAVAAAVSALTGPLRGAYNRLRVSGVA